MVSLPPISDLIRRARALAALDLILSPEWDPRYYSFNASWGPSEQMASMRNGSGDEWWMVFHGGEWAALKGLGHESPAWARGGAELSAAIRGAFPPELGEFTREEAFGWEATSFGYYCLSSTGAWIHANAATAYGSLESGDEELLGLLIGGAEDYVAFAEEYYEVEIPLEIVEAVCLLQPITEEMVRRLNPEIKLSEVSGELFGEVGYPR